MGAGRAGCSVARYLASNGAIELVGFCSRTEAGAASACEAAGGTVLAKPQEAARLADTVFITTPDSAIAEVWGDIAAAARAGEVDLASKTVAHCSGATPSTVFAGAGELGCRAMSMHPLYAMSDRERSWRELDRCWFALEGDTGACAGWRAVLERLGNRCALVPTGSKARYHAAAVMASNLVVGLYDLAADELSRCGFTRADAEAALAPLFLGNAEHVARDGVAASLTGPAARGDKATIEGHLEQLDGDALEAYRVLTRRIAHLAGHDGLLVQPARLDAV